MNRTNTALLGVILAATVAVIAGVRLAAPPPAQPEPRAAQNLSDDTRPSPVADSVDVVVRTRKAPEPPAQPTSSVKAASNPAYDSRDTSKDWSVVAATLNSVEHAEKRARSLRESWRECACTVFPKGESQRYFVVVGTGLDRNAADRLRDRATAAGLPGDTYVTKLIQRSDPQP